MMTSMATKWRCLLSMQQKSMTQMKKCLSTCTAVKSHNMQLTAPHHPSKHRLFFARGFQTTSFCLNEETNTGSSHTRASGYVSTVRKSFPSLEELVFHMLSQGDGTISVSTFFDALQSKGLTLNDPRLKESMDKFRTKHLPQFPERIGDKHLTADQFKECIQDNIVLIGRALQNKLIIPDFPEFAATIQETFLEAKNNESGEIADYIPQLARQDPNSWGVSICTVDGQRCSFGDTTDPFSFQSSSKAPAYALASTLMGSDFVHRHIGFEPSGQSFNALFLNNNNMPHNPMLNSGAIVTAALIKPELTAADRFDFIMSKFREAAGGEMVGFSNATFLSEKKTGFRNFALAYLLQDYNCFPAGADPVDTLDLYFQICSLEVNCESASVIAATLANGGICPLTGKKVFESVAVRDTLSLMLSCGMYDFSGQFAFQVGMPAKSGVSGGVMLVVPNIMGIMMWSPLLDSYGNSTRGIQFCQDLVTHFNFHNYDNLRHHSAKKIDPVTQRTHSQATRIMKLLFGAYNGDASALRQYFLQGMDMSESDYDSRTALHLAAAEGHLECVEFLLEKCSVSLDVLDRWGHTPIDDARLFGHTDVVEMLENFKSRRQEQP
ncbi:glutaminase kidney isoform, mitochondrial-like isoform X1 [Lytechinus variegatus]|uniref:glutaminase kidney isoform, mitochondrial-like isoform X1 n=1 Tax=Lytechinus variegatus TaxID=7654 RepID=UPI001BB224C5|nr:glutaminase kidney isoform, mitochondrial-like isoform X1 [Lytechinus variegatus]